MIMHYLVRHGTPGFLGRFAAADDSASDFTRGRPFVVKSRRGLELGELLGPADAGFDDPFLGELVRPASDGDLATGASHSVTASQLYQDALRLAGELDLPLAVLDLELLLDGRHAVLHAVRLGDCDAGPLLAALGERHDIVVLLFDLTVEPEPHGCGSCGDGGCGSGCGDGGCGTCSAGGAAELAAYFAELRTQMERGRVPLA